MVIPRLSRLTGDLPALACLASYSAYHAWAISQIPVPVWDGAAYLILARNLLNGQPLYEFFRPLVLPGLIALTWFFTGVNFEAPKIFPLSFTVGSAWILYSLVKSRKGRSLALLTTLLFLLASPIMLWTDHLLPHSMTTFFVLLSVWFLNRGTLRGWLLGGVSSSLAVLARYPTAIVVLGIFLVYLLEHRKLLLANFLALGTILPIVPVYFYSPQLLLDIIERNFAVWSRISSGEVTFSAPSPSLPIHFYVITIPEIFSTLVPFLILSLISRSTYRDRFTRVFAVWFIVAFGIFSLVSNKQRRFMFEWVPAIALLSVDGIHKAWRPVRNQIPLGAKWGSLRTSLRALLACSLLTLLGASVLFAVNNQFSVYRRDYLNVNAGNQINADLVKVAVCVKNMTTPEDVIISDFQAPIVALYSERLVYSVQPLPMDKLRLLLVTGYGPELKTPALVVFLPKMSGYDPNVLLQQDFLQLKASFLVSKSLGTVYIFAFTG